MKSSRPHALTGALLVTGLFTACAESSSSPASEPAPVETRSALTLGTPHLVKDLRPGELPIDPYDFPSSFSPEGFVSLGGTTFYAADDGTGDIELWKTDGTREGTSLLRDLVPGPAPSYPSKFTVMGGRLYFIARSAPTSSALALWQSDGTPEGTTLVAPLAGSASFMTAQGNALYFMTAPTGGARGFTLWKSDGTAAGTTAVTTVTASTTSPYGYFTWSGSTLFFTAFDDAHGRELWKSDGTPAGTQLVADVLTGNDVHTGPFDLVSAGSLVYFTTPGIDDYRYVLWRSDGTPEGTFRLLSLQASQSTSGTAKGVAVGGKLYFAQWDAQAGQELWSSDGTVAGTTRVADLRPGTEDSLPHDLVEQGGRLWFTANDGGSPRRAQVWVSDGTAAGTRQVTETTADTPYGASVLAASPDGAWFMTSDFTGASSLWTTDGTVAGTQKLLVPAPVFFGLDRHPTEGGRLFLSQSEGFLWFSDGTAAGSRALGRVIPTQRGAFPHSGFNLGGELVFSARGDTGDIFSPNAERVWRSNGTSNGTLLVDDLTQGDNLHLTPLGVMGGQGFVWRHTNGAPNNSSHLGALLRTDGTPRGTSSLKQMSLPKTAYDARQPPPAVILGDAVYFGVTGSASGPSALWKTDGTSQGTLAVATVQESSFFNVNPRLFVNAGGRLFFAAGTGLGDESLWTSDGTGQGTRKVKALSSKSLSQPPIRHMIALGTQVLFWAESQAEGHALWTSDGTEQGTRVLMRFDGSTFLTEGPLTTAVMNGQVFFVTRASGAPARLWKTDGGTPVEVASFGALDSATAPTRLTVFQGALLFWAFDAAHGYELWRSDGTSAGTALVKDLNPGPASAVGEPGPLVSVEQGGVLLFAASDGLSGLELWQTDGTASNTVRVADIAPGPDSSSPTDLAVAGRGVYFQAWTRESGAELWALERPVADTQPPQVTCPPAQVQEATTEFGQPVSYPRATATDAQTPSPLIRYSRPSGSYFSLGVTRVDVTALDDAGNSATCGIDVTIRDTTPPTITCRTGTLRYEATSPEGTYGYILFDAATASDVASRPSVVFSPAVTSLFPLGTTRVTATATDGAGLQATCGFDVFVEDTQRPTLGTCPASLMLEASAPAGAVADFTLPSATDVASAPAVSSEPAMGSWLPLGTTSFTVTARDTAGNTDACTFPVEVRDTTPPTLTCPPTQRVDATSEAGATVSWPDATAEDRVSDVTVEYSVASGTQFPVGTRTVRVTAKDASNNTRSCEFSVVVSRPADPNEHSEDPSSRPDRGGGCQQAGGAGLSSFGAALLGVLLMRPRRRWRSAPRQG
ncbi:HYR domain-containing protein [Pyxidicoccus parkwayensis]|uniref:HYR domain-containing protein n=1 Tax=Pyxidicoccus parkwayensis TaxID=2813578 RepID=A0ABX7P5Q2_9BACT|nr:ELWxxDGT repeat protein [Pyxidicoccus parkwaysis]QSQ25773.1 HYR domain-containing protein [Pyxidicoccus parkwaysis]